MDFDSLFGQLGEHTVSGLSKGAVYALVAMGYTLVYGVLRLINFAHSEVFMVGTWTVFGVYTWLGVTSNSSAGLVLGAMVLALLAAALASATVALTVERVAYRPLRRKNAPPLIFLITAIGCSLVLSETFGQVLPWLAEDSKVAWTNDSPFGRASQTVEQPIAREDLFTIGDTSIDNRQLLLIVCALVMMIALDLFVNKTRAGRGVRAVAQDPDTAALMGVNKDRVIMLIFVLGGAMAGVAAFLYEVRYGITRFDVGFLIGVKAFTAAVLGGIGNLRGALVGGLLLGVVEVYASILWSSKWEDLVAFVVLVLVLMFRPTGLLGESLGKARV